MHFWKYKQTPEAAKYMKYFCSQFRLLIFFQTSAPRYTLIHSLQCLDSMTDAVYC